MARITSELAARKLGNIYDMILIASRRARELNAGYQSFVNTNDSTTVKAVREIEQGHIGREYLLKPAEIERNKSRNRSS